jgi:hypothetical protein
MFSHYHLFHVDVSLLVFLIPQPSHTDFDFHHGKWMDVAAAVADQLKCKQEQSDTQEPPVRSEFEGEISPGLAFQSPPLASSPALAPTKPNKNTATKSKTAAVLAK